MIVNPVRYGKGGAAKTVEVTIKTSGNTTVYYLNADGEVNSPTVAGQFAFSTIAGSLVVTRGNDLQDFTGIKPVETLIYAKAYIWQAGS